MSFTLLKALLDITVFRNLLHVVRGLLSHAIRGSISGDYHTLSYSTKGAGLGHFFGILFSYFFHIKI